MFNYSNEILIKRLFDCLENYVEDSLFQYILVVNH